MAFRSISLLTDKKRIMKKHSVSQYETVSVTYHDWMTVAKEAEKAKKSSDRHTFIFVHHHCTVSLFGAQATLVSAQS